MNWRIFIFLVFSYSVCFRAQDALLHEPCPPYAWSLHEPCDGALLSSGNDKQSIQWPDYPTNNLQYSWSVPDHHNPHHQSRGWPSLYSNQASIASICHSWNEQDFAREIERSINHCMACGYFRQQAELRILEQHALYVFPNFISNIQKLDNYRSYIKDLHHKLLNNQGRFYRARRALGCVNRGYIQLRTIIEQLHNQMLLHELSEIHQSELIEHDATHWHELRKIYKEEHVGNVTRIDRRIKALKNIDAGYVVYTEQTYTISSSAAALLYNSGSDSAQYTTLYGNQLQHALHQECIEGIEHLSTLRPSSTLYPYQQGIAQCFDAAREYNQAGLTHEASTVADFGWALLDCGLAIAEGTVEGVMIAVKDMAAHPVQTAICAIAGEYVLAYQLGKVLYNVADIGVTALIDADQARQKWDEYVAPVTQLIDALERKQITVRDALKGATQFAVAWKTQDKLFKGLGTICSTAKTKAIEYAKNNPLSTPQEYMATPEGILLKSVNNTPPSGSSFKYERKSRFFVANHEEIAALAGYAQQSMQPPQEVLQGLGRDSLYAPESFLKHIFAAELKEKIFSSEKIEKSLSGFHHFVPEYLEKMRIQLINSITCKKTGIIIADVLCDGHLEPGKTSFPITWSRKKTIEKLGEAVKNPVKPYRIEGKRAILFGATSEDIIIRIVVDLHSGEYITAYPDAHANGLLL